MGIRVFLVDDEPAVLRGLELLLNREPDIQVCGKASDAANALAQIVQLKPDVAVIDLSLFNSNGMDLIRELRAFNRAPHILVFSMHTANCDIRAAFRAGADGYVTKEEGTENLIDAIRSIMCGHSFLTAALASRLGTSAAELRLQMQKRAGL